MKIRSKRRKVAAFLSLSALLLSTLVPMSAFAADDSAGGSGDSSGVDPALPDEAETPDPDLLPDVVLENPGNGNNNGSDASDKITTCDKLAESEGLGSLTKKENANSGTFDEAWGLVEWSGTSVDKIDLTLTDGATLWLCVKYGGEQGENVQAQAFQASPDEVPGIFTQDFGISHVAYIFTPGTPNGDTIEVAPTKDWDFFAPGLGEIDFDELQLMTPSGSATIVLEVAGEGDAFDPVASWTFDTSGALTGSDGTNEDDVVELPEDADYRFVEPTEFVDVDGYDCEALPREVLTDGSFTNVCTLDTSIEVDKLTTGNTAPGVGQGEFEICIEPYRELVARAEMESPNGVEYPLCTTLGRGDGHAFDGVDVGTYRVFERSADPEPSSVSYSGGDAIEDVEGRIVTIDVDNPTASVTVTNNYVSIQQVPPSASVEVLKAWELEIDGEAVDLDDVTLPTPSFDVTLTAGEETHEGTVAAGSSRTFTNLGLNRTYDVAVTEDTDSFSQDAQDVFAGLELDEELECSFVGTTYDDTDATVTATRSGGSVTITATNAYECTTPEPSPELTVQLDKAWDVPVGEDQEPLADVDGIEVAFTVGDLGPQEDGSFVVEPGETYELSEVFSEEALDAALGEQCTFDAEDATFVVDDGAPQPFPGSFTVPEDLTEDTVFEIEVTNPITCVLGEDEEIDDPTAPAISLEMVKVWNVPEDADGPLVDVSGIEVGFTVGDLTAGEDGSFALEPGESYLLTEVIDEDALNAALIEGCSFDADEVTYTIDGGDPQAFPAEFVVPEDVTEDTVFEIEVTNPITCVLGEVVDDDETDDETDPDPAPVATEVAAEQADLPRTGASALLLSLFGLLGVGLGGGMLRYRAREE